MVSMRNGITSGILAILAATVLACGTIKGASGKAGSEVGGGDNYLTADDGYGVGSWDPTGIGVGSAGAPAADGFSPSLQP